MFWLCSSQGPLSSWSFSPPREFTRIFNCFRWHHNKGLFHTMNRVHCQSFIIIIHIHVVFWTLDCLFLRLRAIGIFVFLKILIGYFGEDGKLLAEMELPVTFRSPPCCCCCVCMKGYTLNRSVFIMWSIPYTYFLNCLIRILET